VSQARRLIDISVALECGIRSDPPGLEPEITYLDHHQTVSQLLPFFPGLAAADLPDGEAWAIERMALTTHNGTHLDAPWHYASTMNRGEPAATIDQIPLEWCYQRGVKLDFRHLADGYVVTPGDIERELTRIGHEVEPLDIVLMNTAAGSRYGGDDYVDRGCGCGRDGTLWLLERGVRITGTDGWSWDAPFSHTAQHYRETGDARLIWEGHKAGREIGYCHLEKLANLDQLPATGFEVCCFPVKIRGASAGWTRAVAIVAG
jgi:kynurenine formamidase